MERILFLLIFITIWITAASTSVCDSNSKCECDQNDNSVTCGRLNVKYYPEKRTEFKCNSNETDNYSDFYGSNFVNSPVVIFINCNVPKVSFSEIFNSTGITNVKGLIFKSSKKLYDSLHADHFLGLTDNLTLLNFENNFFTNFPFDIFQNMTKLRKLNLRNNALHHLSEDLVLQTPNLEYLELGNNNLSTLPSNIFQNLGNLTLLSLGGNQFRTLDSDCFKGLKRLETLDLRSNNLETLSVNLFQYNVNLKRIYLNENNLTSLPIELFSFNENLEEIVITRNSLSNLPEQLFNSTKELKVINLSYNQIESLPRNIFNSQHKLRNLDLQFNNIKCISDGVLNNLKSLEKLNIKGNGMILIAKNLFQDTSSLQDIDASDNYLNFSKTDEVSVFHNCGKMRIFKLQNNTVKTIYSDFQTMLQLRTLNLQRNEIQSLNFSNFNFTSPYVTVDLQYNNITTIDLLKNRLNDEVRSNILVTFNLQHNPLNCDCKIWYLYKVITEQNEQNFSKNFKFLTDELRCAEPKNIFNETVKNVNPKDFVCQLPQCPSKCNCWQRSFDKSNYINCSFANYSEIPEFLPDYNNDWDHITLNMSHNNLIDISENNMVNFSYVNTLDLSYNYISKINPKVFPLNLENLYLNNNNITHLPKETLEYFENLGYKTLAIYNNPYDCNCSALTFLKFIRKHLDSLVLSNNITCYETNLEIQNLRVNDLCKTYTLFIIIVSLIITFLGFISAVVISLYYRNQHAIKVWLYSRNLCIWFITEHEIDRDKLFDAFISFSQKDEDFVTNELVRKLENEEPKFKLCVHYRDWIAGDYIPNQIIRSVEDSRRTIFVLSNSFLESVWGRLEFKAAHLQALEDRTSRIIVIVYGDLPDLNSLDEELRSYISMNTYLKWDDPLFWQKLRYAMPHNRRQEIRRTRVRDGDKYELVKQDL